MFVSLHFGDFDEYTDRLAFVWIIAMVSGKTASWLTYADSRALVNEN